MPLTPQQRVQMQIDSELVPKIAELIYQADKKSRHARLADLRTDDAKAVYLAEALMVLAPEARADRKQRVQVSDAHHFAIAEHEQETVARQARIDGARFIGVVKQSKTLSPRSRSLDRPLLGRVVAGLSRVGADGEAVNGNTKGSTVAAIEPGLSNEVNRSMSRVTHVISSEQSMDLPKGQDVIAPADLLGWTSGPLPNQQLEQAACELFADEHPMGLWSEPGYSDERNKARRQILRAYARFLKMSRWTLGNMVEQLEAGMGQMVFGDRGPSDGERKQLHDYAAACISDLFSIFMGDNRAAKAVDSPVADDEDEIVSPDSKERVN